MMQKMPPIEKSQNRKTSFLVRAYNEEKTLKPEAHRLDEIILIGCGSVDAAKAPGRIRIMQSGHSGIMGTRKKCSTPHKDRHGYHRMIHGENGGCPDNRVTGSADYLQSYEGIIGL